jgi:NAD(P)H-flavin reductase
MTTTVDREAEGWTGNVGFVPNVTEKVAPSARDAVAIVCGPPVMIRFTFPVLAKLGFTPDNMITTLEKRMKCGVGKCGRCNIGDILRLPGRPGLFLRADPELHLQRILVPRCFFLFPRINNHYS